VAPGLDVGSVLLDHRADHTGTILEVVLHGDGVPRSRGAVDLAEADGVEPPSGEEPLCGMDETNPGRLVRALQWGEPPADSVSSLRIWI